MPANSAESSPTSPDLLSRSAMGARFPPAQGPAVDCPEYSTGQCKTVQSHAREAILPAARPGSGSPPAVIRRCLGLSFMLRCDRDRRSLHRLTSTGRHVAAKAPWVLEPDIALGPLTRRKGMPTPMVRLTRGPQPRGRRLRAHVAAPCARTAAHWWKRSAVHATWAPMLTRRTQPGSASSSQASTAPTATGWAPRTHGAWAAPAWTELAAPWEAGGSEHASRMSTGRRHTVRVACDRECARLPPAMPELREDTRQRLRRRFHPGGPMKMLINSPETVVADALRGWLPPTRS